MQNLSKYGAYALAAVFVIGGATWYFSDSLFGTQAQSRSGTATDHNSGAKVVSPVTETEGNQPIVAPVDNPVEGTKVDQPATPGTNSETDFNKKPCSLTSDINKVDEELKAELEAAEDEYERQQILEDWESGCGEGEGKIFEPGEEETVTDESTEDQASENDQEPVPGC